MVQLLSYTLLLRREYSNRNSIIFHRLNYFYIRYSTYNLLICFTGFPFLSNTKWNWLVFPHSSFISNCHSDSPICLFLNHQRFCNKQINKKFPDTLTRNHYHRLNILSMSLLIMKATLWLSIPNMGFNKPIIYVLILCRIK